MLWTLFGERCDYYDNCFALYNMLDSESVFANVHNFTACICRQITWAILNDSRQYFFKTLTVDDFSSGHVRWPTSLLMQIVGADVHACREICMGNFPEKWGPKSTVASFAHSGNNKGGGSQHTRLPPGYPPSVTTQYPPVPPTDTSSSTAAIDRPVVIRQMDIHPRIKALMAPYVAYFRSVQFCLLCKAANVAEEDLPSLPKYVSNGKNGLCYSYILGKCQGKVCGRAQARHVPAHELSEDFVTALCSRLAPGVEKRMAMEPPNTAQQWNAQGGGKRFKRAN